MLRLKECNDFMRMAGLAAEKSTCHKIKIGAVLGVYTNKLDCYYKASSGYHGFIESCKIDKQGLCPDKIKCLAIRSEQRALIEALSFFGRTLFDTNNKIRFESALFLTHNPCDDSVKLCVYTGIKRIIYKEMYTGICYDKWEPYIEIIWFEDIKNDLP